MKPERLEEEEDSSEPVLDDGAKGGNFILDGGSLDSNSKAGVSRYGNHTDDQEAFLGNGPEDAGGPESDESTSVEDVDENNYDDGLFLLAILLLLLLLGTKPIFLVDDGRGAVLILAPLHIVTRAMG